MKKGFTLIELLAVIVILAIIALIATPIVLNIINDTKESSQLRSAEFYLDAVETAIAQSTLNDKKLENKSYNILENGNLCIEYKDNECINELEVKVSGEVPSSGSITIENGKIEEIKLKYENDKIVVYDDNKKIVYGVPEPYQENENIEIPNLYNNTLTPIIYDGNNWIIADVTDKWYSYSNQEWANAVILDSSVKKGIGDPITVEGTNPDVLAMFVWIPRYEYKIEGTYGKGGTSASNPGEIEVNFVTLDKKEASEAYIMHPAFNFGGEDINGLWVGKFELSHKTKTSSLGCTNENCEEANGLRILPNVQSLRNNSVSSFFYAIRSMSKFGIDSKLTDPHMIKNSEWGAVAYLSQSKYGKYGNSDYEGLEKEIYQNKDLYITGMSNGKPSINTYRDGNGGQTANNSNTVQCLYYEIANNCGIGASTTGNIYGIYDMSGGAVEYVMGVLLSKVGSSGFVNLDQIENKYYDDYPKYGENDLGHAISETSSSGGGDTSWYNDASNYLSYSFLVRGGNYKGSKYAGIFYFRVSSSDGSADNDNGTRAVLTPTT